MDIHLKSACWICGGTVLVRFSILRLPSICQKCDNLSIYCTSEGLEEYLEQCWTISQIKRAQEYCQLRHRATLSQLSKY